MTETLVQIGEIIQIEKDKRKRMPIAASAGNLFGSQGTKAFLVEQAGKWINQSLGRLRLDGFQLVHPLAQGLDFLKKLGVGF